MQTAREFAEWNEQMAQRYDIERYYRDAHPVIRWIERRRLDIMRSLADVKATDSLLEVGCGAGHVLENFESSCRIGLDLSVTMLAGARRRLGSATHLLLGSAEHLPIGDASIDVVICTILEHTQDPERVLAELVRVVTSGGRVVVSIPNERTIDAGKRLLRRVPIVRQMLRALAREGNEWHLHRFDVARLRAAAANIARIRCLHAVPSKLIPVGFVALVQPLNPRSGS